MEKVEYKTEETRQGWFRNLYSAILITVLTALQFCSFEFYMKVEFKPFSDFSKTEYLLLIMFGFLMLHSWWRVIEPKVTPAKTWITLNENGFKIADFVIDWDEFVSADVQSVQDMEFVVIKLKSYDKYFAAKSGKDLRKMNLDQRQFGSPIAVSSGEMFKPPQDVADIINKYRNKIGK